MKPEVLAAIERVKKREKERMYDAHGFRIRKKQRKPK